MPRLTKAERLDRDTKALQLRRAGANYEEIARALHYANPSHAWKAVTGSLRDTKREVAGEVLELELHRLDVLQRATWPRAAAGDDRAVQNALRVMDHRAKLTGLYNVVPIADHDSIRQAFAGFLDQVRDDPRSTVKPATAASIHGHAATVDDTPKPPETGADGRPGDDLLP